MRDNSNDRKVERSYIQKWRFLIGEYELVKAVEFGRWPEQVRPYTRNRRQVLYGPIVGG